MYNVICINRNLLTVGELNVIKQRIDEISNILDLCGSNNDDIVDNLTTELTTIENRILKSLKTFNKRKTA